jgi:hypothetical protein
MVDRPSMPLSPGAALLGGLLRLRAAGFQPGARGFLCIEKLRFLSLRRFQSGTSGGDVVPKLRDIPIALFEGLELVAGLACAQFLGLDSVAKGVRQTKSFLGGFPLRLQIREARFDFTNDAFGSPQSFCGLLEGRQIGARPSPCRPG